MLGMNSMWLPNKATNKYLHIFCSSLRLFSTLPKFVRGCDHVVKFFQCDKRSRKKSETKRLKGTSKKEDQSNKVKCKEFDTPHRIAEAVREHSLGGKEKSKKKIIDATNSTKQSQNNMAGENVTKSNKHCAHEESLVTDTDENGNEVKVFLLGKLITCVF